MTFYKRLQAILEGYSIDTAHQVSGMIDLSNAVSAFDNGALTYAPTDTDLDIIKVGNRAHPTERMDLTAYDNNKNKLESSKVKILHPFEVNVNYKGKLTTTIETILDEAITCNGSSLTYDLEVSNFKAASRDDARTVAALGLMRQMQADTKIAKILAEVEIPATVVTKRNKKDSRGTVKVVTFLQALRGTFFRTYRKNAGIAIAQRLKKIASGSGISVPEYDRFMGMCAYALRNVTKAKPGEKSIVYDFIIKPESSSNFNDELINALKSADSNGKIINPSCTNAKVITIQKLRSSATTSMTPVAQQAANQAHIDQILADAKPELYSYVLKQNRATYAFVKFVQCPMCNFKYGEDKIKQGYTDKNVAYNSKSNYSENSADLRALGSPAGGRIGTTCGNPTKVTKTCTYIIDSLEKRLKIVGISDQIAGITFQSITRAARQTGKSKKFDTWAGLANDWADTELRKLRDALTRTSSGIGPLKIAHTFGNKRRYVKLYGRAGLHSQQLSMIADKNCLLIDDNVAGGSTIELIEQIVQHYEPKRVDAFVPLKLAD